MNHPVKVVWITKYALTRGIIEAEAEIVDAGDRVYASTRADGFKVFTADFTYTREEALATAEKKRAKKIAALRKQAEKLAAMTIKVQER